MEIIYFIIWHFLIPEIGIAEEEKEESQKNYRDYPEAFSHCYR
jgi:hypothetical protein